MKYSLYLYAICAMAVLSIVIAQAQSGSNATKHYEKSGIAFDYPVGWDLNDDSSELMPTVTLTRPGSVAQIVIRTQSKHWEGIPPVRRVVSSAVLGPGMSSPQIEVPDRDPCAFELQRKKIAGDLSEQLVDQIRADATQRPTSSTLIGSSDVEGVQLKGVVDRKRVTGNVYTTRLARKFVSLTYIRADDDERAKSAWDTVRTSLKIESGIVAVKAADPTDSSDKHGSGEVSNGRVVLLPQPTYPKIARSAHAAGVVTVQVTIDETGNVIAAHAVAGHPLLQATSVAAAREAKFSPTKLCGEPVKVTGVISYNFAAQ